MPSLSRLPCLVSFAAACVCVCSRAFRSCLNRCVRIQTQPCCCSRLCSPPSSTPRWLPFWEAPFLFPPIPDPSSFGSATTSKCFNPSGVQKKRLNRRSQTLVKKHFSGLHTFLNFHITNLKIILKFVFCRSTKRIDNSNSRLVSQVDKETGKLFRFRGCLLFDGRVYVTLLCSIMVLSSTQAVTIAT